MPHKDANELAEAILDARREDESAHRAIAYHFRFGYSPSRYWYDQGMSEVEAVHDKIADALDDLDDALSLDKWESIHALETPILDLLEGIDTSQTEDLHDSHIALASRREQV